MKALIFVSLKLHYGAARQNVHEADTGVVGCHHGQVLVKELDTCHLATTGELAIVVLHIDCALELQLLGDTLLGLRALRMDFGVAEEA